MIVLGFFSVSTLSCTNCSWILRRCSFDSNDCLAAALKKTMPVSVSISKRINLPPQLDFGILTDDVDYLDMPWYAAVTGREEDCCMMVRRKEEREEATKRPHAMAIDDCDMEMGQNLERPKISWFTLPNYYQISIMFPMFPNISLPVYSLRPNHVE